MVELAEVAVVDAVVEEVTVVACAAGFFLRTY